MCYSFTPFSDQLSLGPVTILLVSCWKIAYLNIKKLLLKFQKLLLKFLHIFILRSIYNVIPRVLFPVSREGLNWSEKGENELKRKLEREVRHQGGYCTTGKYKGHVLRTLSTARMLTPDSSPVTQSLIICTWSDSHAVTERWRVTIPGRHLNEGNGLCIRRRFFGKPILRKTKAD